MPRYFFVLPDVQKPTGGNAVAMQLTQILRSEGFDANVVNGNSNYQYAFGGEMVTPYYYPQLAYAEEQFMNRRAKLVKTAQKLVKPSIKRKNPLLTLQPDDVFMIPEFRYPEYSALFPDNKRVLFCQATLMFCQALSRDLKRGANYLNTFSAILTVSEATQATIEQFAKRESFQVSQSIARTSLIPTTAKKRQIAYMPRKRRTEANAIVSCLKRTPSFTDWTFRAMEDIPRNAVDQILNESLIFLSFASNPEGFGLPPAEAMAAGCIVVGYTGVGGNEFFNAETGVPVPDGDITSFAQYLEGVMAEYAQDPTRLDALRFAAAREIAQRYNPDRMRRTLLSAWEKIDAIVTN